MPFTMKENEPERVHVCTLKSDGRKEEQYYVGFSQEYTEYRGSIGTNDFYGAISLQSF